MLKLIKKIIAIGIGTALLASFAGCTKAQQSVSEKTVVSENTPKEALTIVTSFYPIYISTLNIAKDIEGVEVVNMTEPITGCLHDYTLTTKDMKTLEEADILIINGAGMESFMDKITQQMPNLHIIEASAGIPLIEEEGEVNPHVFVSISDAMKQVEQIAKELTLLDNTHSEAYQTNADAYNKRLDVQRTKMHEVLDHLVYKDIVTFHEAFPYFAKEFNLNIVGVVQREPGSEPSAKELATTIEQVKALGVKALFAEPQYPQKAAEAIAQDTGAVVYTLDPAVTGELDADAYINIMEKNLKVLEEALK